MTIQKELVKREIAGDTILVPVGKTVYDSNGLFILNELAAFIWKLLPEAETEEQIQQVNRGLRILPHHLERRCRGNGIHITEPRERHFPLAHFRREAAHQHDTANKRRVNKILTQTAKKLFYNNYCKK